MLMHHLYRQRQKDIQFCPGHACYIFPMATSIEDHYTLPANINLPGPSDPETD